MKDLPQNVTGHELDAIYDKANTYKKIAKIVVIVSYIILLLGVAGFMSISGFGFLGAILGLGPFGIGFIVWILLQLVAEIVRILSRRILSAIPGAIDSEVEAIRARNRRNYIIFGVFIGIVITALVLTVILSKK